ncbi:MAG: hypothetical protein J6A25_03240 [Lachnospiraceae bacterium]|nr:hypothetical protein [Lachnospiraceae bacterium]
MHNKQHVYVHKVLTDLNLSIYKSKNQFIIDAVEHYAKSLNQEDLTNTAAEQHIRAGQTKEGPDTEALKKEIVNEVTVAVQTNVISVLMTELAKLKLGAGSKQKFIEEDVEDEYEEEPEFDIPDDFRDVIKGLAGMGE